MLVGERVYLAAIEKEDLKQLKDWRNIPDFRKHFREYKEINEDMQENWYQNKVMNDTSTIMFSVRRLEDDELLGCCGLCYINWIHRNADLSLYIGWNNEYIDDNGFAEEGCKLLFEYGFGELGLNKIWTEIYEFDNKKKRLYDKIGLKVDGVLRENYYYNNKWWNSYIMSILRSDYYR
jgi:RimJ/RimL family protein N-acetyltransferase